MTTLALETSSRVASAALVDARGNVLAESTWEAGRGATSSPLHEFLAGCREAFPLPQRLLVGLGPGSYAGTRIGIAAALGAGTAWQVPVFGLPSVLGYEAGGSALRVIGDARRETAYHAIIAQGRCLEGPELVTRARLEELLATQPDLPVVSADPPPWLILGIPIVFPTAVLLARNALLAPEELVSGSQGLEPLYLRPPTITTPRKQAHAWNTDAGSQQQL